MKIKKFLRNYYIFLLIIFLSKNFSFFSNFKIFFKKKLFHEHGAKYHVNKNLETRRINLIFLYQDIERYIFNFIKNQNLVKINFFINLNLAKISLISIYLKIFSSLYFLNKKYKNLSYLIYLIFLNEAEFFSNKKKYNNQIEKKLVDYLKLTFFLKNLTVLKKSPKYKNEIAKKYFQKYHDLLSLKNLEIAIEHSISDYELLTKVKKKISKYKNPYLIDKKYFLGSSLYAYGHLMNYLEIMLRKKLVNKTIISPYYLANTFLGLYIKKKYKNKIQINHSKFLDILDKRLMDTSLNYEEINNKDSIYQLSFSEYKKTKKIRSILNLELIKKITKRFNFQKLDIRGEYVCINLRDSSFKSYDKKIISNNDRLVIPSYLKNIIKYLNGFDLKVVLLNGHVKFDYHNLNFINYANSKYKNDFNDILLLKNCYFIINFGQTSSTVQDLLFDKYSIHLDYPFNRKPIFNPKAFYCLRPFYKNKKKMKFKDFFNNDLFINHDFKILKDKGYILGSSTYQETIKNLFNFINIVKKKGKNSFKKKAKYFYPFNILN